MLSRKLLGSIAVGVLSVALVPATWARTHSRLASRAIPSKQLVSKSATARPVTTIAPKTPAHHMTASRVATHKIASKAPVLHKTTSHKFASRHTTHSTLTSHRTTGSKLASKNVVSHRTLPTHSTKLASSKMISAKRPVINPKLVKKTHTT